MGDVHSYSFKGLWCRHRERQKFRRKAARQRKRQVAAKLRDELAAADRLQLGCQPAYWETLEVERLSREQEEKDREVNHRLWLQRELSARIEFEKGQQLARLQLAEKQRRRKEEERLMRQLLTQDIQAVLWLLQTVAMRLIVKLESKIRILQVIPAAPSSSNSTNEEDQWHNPYLTEYGTDLNALTLVKSTRPTCRQFERTGSCPKRSMCCWEHQRPETSECLLFPNMFTNFSLQQRTGDKFDVDLNLEFDQRELYKDFRDFYADVRPEMEKFGPIVKFVVCQNRRDHLRGNVYVEYDTFDAALRAFALFHGRWYNGRLLYPEFTPKLNWSQAICGQFMRSCCPRGHRCFYLHPFPNPQQPVRSAVERQSQSHSGRRSSGSSRSSRHSRTPSESPEQEGCHRRRRSGSRHRRRSIRRSTVRE